MRQWLPSNTRSCIRVPQGTASAAPRGPCVLLFSGERMAMHAQRLAAACHSSPPPRAAGRDPTSGPHCMHARTPSTVVGAAAAAA